MKISSRLCSGLVGCALAALLCVTACGGAPAANDPTMAENAPTSSAAHGGSSLGGTPVDGPALYAAHCSSCHGESKKHSTAAAIQKAIDGNEGKMGSLKGLTAAQVAAIASAR